MAELSNAYQVLSDPERRQHYDTTGKIKGATENKEGYFIKFINDVMNMVLNPKYGIDVAKKDLSEVFKQCAKEGLEQIETELENLTEKQTRISEIAKRLKIKDSDKSSIMSEYLSAQKKSVEASINQHHNEQSKINELLKVIKGFSYEVDKVDEDRIIDELKQFQEMYTGGFSAPNFHSDRRRRY